MSASPIDRIVASYDAPVVRAYSKIRFSILRQPFLEEIDQWLPRAGKVLDLGCGFGLFSLYFASTQPDRRLTGVDLDARRVELARRSARKLGLSNADYEVGNALEWSSSTTFDAIYMLDVVHHLPAARIPGFLASLAAMLRPGGILLLKEVSDRPRHKMLFTLLLDRLMVGRDPIHYWSPPALTALLRGVGLDVKRHRMKDFLPYPHLLYICRRAGLPSAPGAGRAGD